MYANELQHHESERGQGETRSQQGDYARKECIESTHVLDT